MKRINIMGVPFDAVTETEALKIILGYIGAKNMAPRFVATPNPEMLLAAHKNAEFLKILNHTDLNIADGTGILWAAKYLHDIRNVRSRLLKIAIGLKDLFLTAFYQSRIRTVLPERVTGTDMMEMVCGKIDKNNKVFLLGGSGDSAEKTAGLLKQQYGIQIVGTDNGSADATRDTELVDYINARAPQVLFVAYGTPKQEIWLQRNLPRLTSVKMAMGVGGAFDFIGGNIKRAPALMRRLGLEWLYRVITQPSRLKRILNATVVFPAKLIRMSF